jgi:hypothetical protein
MCSLQYPPCINLPKESIPSSIVYASLFLLPSSPSHPPPSHSFSFILPLLNSQLPLPQPTRLSPLRLQRLHIPDALRILVDAAITAEKAHPCHARDRLRRPLILVFVGLVDERLRLHVAVEVIRDEVVVAVVLDGADERAERAGVAEGAGLDRGEDVGEVGVDGVRAVSVRVAQVFDVFGQVAEEEDIVLADFTGDFDLFSLAKVAIA